MSKVRWHFFRVYVPQGYEFVDLTDFTGWTADPRQVLEEWDAALQMGLKPVLDHRVVEEERLQGVEAEAVLVDLRAAGSSRSG